MQPSASQLAAEAAEVDKAINEAVSTKSYGKLANLEARVNKLAEDRADLDRTEATHKAAGKYAALAAYGADAGNAAEAPTFTTKTGRDVSPLSFTKGALETLHKAVSSHQSVSVKAFSTVESLLPAQLDPVVVGKIHENRLLEHIPAMPIYGPQR